MPRDLTAGDGPQGKVNWIMAIGEKNRAVLDFESHREVIPFLNAVHLRRVLDAAWRLFLVRSGVNLNTIYGEAGCSPDQDPELDEMELGEVILEARGIWRRRGQRQLDKDQPPDWLFEDEDADTVP